MHGLLQSRRTAFIVAVLAMVVCYIVAGCAATPNGDCPTVSYDVLPEDLRGLAESGDSGAVRGRAFAELEANLGEPMPSFDVADIDGEVIDSSHLIRGATALVLLPTQDASLCRKWVNHYERNGWKTGTGRTVFVLLDSRARPELFEALPRRDHIFKFERPLPGFLGYAVISPMVLEVSEDSVFEDYHGRLE